MGVLAAVFSILAVMICVLLFPERFFLRGEMLKGLAQLSSWSGFLILGSVAIGTLYERNEQRLKELKNAYIGVLEILSKYLESTDGYTKGHSVRVAELATEIATAMELNKPAVENIRAAGLLHDIGKTEISGEIMDSHSFKGVYILSAVGAVLKEVVPIVIAHHKHFVDTIDPEYGDKLKIPLGARIIAVADAFDAMTTDRPYRKGMPPWDAFQEIVAKAGKQFDPEVVGAFKRVMSEKIEQI